LRGKNVCPIAPDIARLADRKQRGKSALFRGLGVSVGYYGMDQDWPVQSDKELAAKILMGKEFG
jgi:hypothetical protein